MIDTFAIRCNVLKLAFSGQLSQHEVEDGAIDDLLKRVNPNREIKQSEAGPYEIPENWAWVKLEDLYEINPKVEAADDTDAAFIPMERISAGFSDSFTFEVQKWSVASKNHMNIIYETSVKEAKPLPDFAGTDDTFVSLALNGLVIDKQMLLVINRIGNERLDTLTTADFLTINALYHDMPLDNHMHDRLKHLTEMGIVEHIGRSKYVLSRSLYSAVGKSGVHTRIVGLDRETNKELLLKHMRKKGKEGASFKEFQQVLPNLSRDQITVLLRGLRRENRAYCAGKTSASRWFAGSMPTTDIEV